MCLSYSLEAWNEMHYLKAYNKNLKTGYAKVTTQLQVLAT